MKIFSCLMPGQRALWYIFNLQKLREESYAGPLSEVTSFSFFLWWCPKNSFLGASPRSHIILTRFSKTTNPTELCSCKLYSAFSSTNKTGQIEGCDLGGSPDTSVYKSKRWETSFRAASGFRIIAFKGLRRLLRTVVFAH